MITRKRINNRGQLENIDKSFIFSLGITNCFIYHRFSLHIELCNLHLILGRCLYLSEDSLIYDLYAVRILYYNFPFIIHSNTYLISVPVGFVVVD